MGEGKLFVFIIYFFTFIISKYPTLQEKKIEIYHNMSSATAMNSGGILSAWQQGIERKNREIRAARKKLEHRSADTLAHELMEMVAHEQAQEDDAVRQCGELRLAPRLQSLSVTQAAWRAMPLEDRQRLLQRCQGSRGIILM